MQLGCDQSIISHAAPRRLSPADTSHLPLHLALVCYIVRWIRKPVGTRIDLWQCFKGQTHPRGATASLRQETGGNWNTGKWLIFLSFTVLLKKITPKQSASPTRTVDGDPPLPPTMSKMWLKTWAEHFLVSAVQIWKWKTRDCVVARYQLVNYLIKCTLL